MSRAHAQCRDQAEEGAEDACAPARRSGLKMAAPWATFHCLLRPWGRSVLLRQAAAVSIRFYGVRAAATGELVTHTGQVRGCGGGSGACRLRAGSSPLGSWLGAGSSRFSWAWSQAGSS